MKVYVNYDDARWKKYKIDFEKIASMAAGHAYRESEVSITLTNDAAIHELNRRYRNIDRPTNVLSFELGDDILMGDIFISLDTVAREAASENISVAEHTAHMVVHGVLHLQGYDHIRDKDAAVMESAEIEIMKKLGYKNPYADDASRAPAWRRFLRGAGRFLAMFALGAASSFGFAPFYFWPATIFGVGVAYALLTRPDGNPSFWGTYRHAAPFGAGYAIAMFWWALNSIYVVPELAAEFAVWTVPALIGMGIAGAIIFSVPFACAGRAQSAAARPFVFAGFWTFVLWLREWAFTGFPWNPVANITMSYPAIANSMALWGALGLTFIIMGIVASGVEMLRHKKCAMCRFPLALFVFLLIVGVFFGWRNMAISSQGAAPEISIRIVQPARAQSEKISYAATREERIAHAARAVENLISLARAPGNAPDLIVFPETTYPFVVAERDMPMAREIGQNIILGATSFSDAKLFNSMIVSDADGLIHTIYNKSHLVPFGEYAPLGIMPSPANLSHGTGPEIITVKTQNGNFSFAPAICYEIIFSDSLIPRGAAPDAIINITNDTWFGRTPGVFQHLDMVRRYAIESGVPIVRANYSGISAFVDAAGRITASIPVGATDALDGRVAGAHKTPYRALGRNAWMIIILIVACIGAGVGARARRK